MSKEVWIPERQFEKRLDGRDVIIMTRGLCHASKSLEQLAWQDLCIVRGVSIWNAQDEADRVLRALRLAEEQDAEARRSRDEAQS